jgi:alkanesulfonate monooxygenase SsuD/methylene tetrahydromethanopterin reductase-like flavin-dependent oxidoreductase (luciferase family)
VFTNLLDAIVHPGDEFIFGSPETVAERIIDQCRRTGAGNVACYHPAVFDEAQLEHHYKLWRQVVPLLHAAEIA